MKKQFLIAMTALSMVALAGCSKQEAADSDSRLAQMQKAGKLTIGVSPDFAPMEFKDVTKTGDDQYVGSDMAMARYIADKMGLELEIKAMD